MPKRKVYMSILLMVLAAIALSLILVLLFALQKPDQFQVVRSIEIEASPESVAPWISDFHKWVSWSPWEHLDADLKKTYMGAPSGIGAKYAWEGRKSGKGSMNILGMEGVESISMRVDFEKPFEAHNEIIFRLERSGSKTLVSWAMSGKNTFFPGKIFQVFVSMDKMIGKDFEKGLDALKNVVESSH